MTRFRRIPARSSLSGVESLELLSSWWEELLALLMSILGVLGVLSELPGVAGVVTSTMPGIRAAGSPCIQIRKAGFVVSSHSHWGVMVGWLVDWLVTDNAHTGVAPSHGDTRRFFDFGRGNARDLGEILDDLTRTLPSRSDTADLEVRRLGEDTGKDSRFPPRRTGLRRMLSALVQASSDERSVFLTPYFSIAQPSMMLQKQRSFISNPQSPPSPSR